MGGSSSVRGDQTIYHTDNLCFDGTDRDAPMDTDGQLWIGATASNRANNGGHVRLGQLTSPGGTLNIGYSAPDITLDVVGGPGTDLHDSRMIVGAGGLSDGANYTTIASAIADAVTAGGQQNVSIQPGTYTEDLTLPANVNLVSYLGSNTPSVTIIGKITCTDAGARTISGIRLQTNSDYFLEVTGSAATVVNLDNSFLNVTNNTGINFTSSSSSARINLFNCNGEIGTTGITYFTHASAGQLNFRDGYFSNSGSSVTSSTQSDGYLSFFHCNTDFAITTSGTTATIQARNAHFQITTFANTVLTHNSTSANCTMIGCNFASGTASAISIGAGALLRLNSCAVSSTNTNVITGAGRLDYGNIGYYNTISTVNVTTQIPAVSSNDALKVVTPGAYPYTTVPQDAVILVDSSSARTITPLASPTTGQRHVIKDSVGSAGTNNITITPSGKNIDGSASTTININYGSVTIIYGGTEWHIV